LYEPYHLKDFHKLSTIVDQNAIAGIDFYSAGYQVRYGDRMSGVVYISLRDPPAGITTELGISFFSTSVLSMGRFGGGDKGDWLVSGRRGNLDLVAEAVNPKYGTPRYQDAFLHFGWEWSERTYISTNALLSYDKISVNELDGTEIASAAGSVHTGWPRTALMVETVTNPDGSTSLIASTTERNSLRHSVFHTIDVRASRQFDVAIGELTAFLEITNLYNRENPCCTKYRLQSDGSGNQSLTSNQGNWLPIIPSLGVIWRF